MDSEKFGAFVVQQDVRMIVDHCSLAILDETIESSSENRSSCDFQGTVPGEKFLLAPMPVQLGGRISPRASYPTGLTSMGFVGCIKNLVHNGEVSLASYIISVLYMYAVMCIKSSTLRHYRVDLIMVYWKVCAQSLYCRKSGELEVMCFCAAV